MMSRGQERPKTVGYGERPRQRLHNDIWDGRSETANPSVRKSRANHSTVDVADKDISDLRKLIQTCKDLQNIDLNQAESLYSHLLTETNNQQELDKEVHVFLWWVVERKILLEGHRRNNTLNAFGTFPYI